MYLSLTKFCKWGWEYWKISGLKSFSQLSPGPFSIFLSYMFSISQIYMRRPIIYLRYRYDCYIYSEDKEFHTCYLILTECWNCTLLLLSFKLKIRNYIYSEDKEFHTCHICSVTFAFVISCVCKDHMIEINCFTWLFFSCFSWIRSCWEKWYWENIFSETYGHACYWWYS